MYKFKKAKKTSLVVNKSYIGETIEQKIDRIMNNKEPLSDGAPRVYTERKDGVQPQYDIRTDRFELAVDAMDIVNKDRLAKREERQKKYDRAKEGGTEGKGETGGDGKTESTGGTADKGTATN